MIIAISGTPGTGKTEIAKALAAALGYNYVSLNDFCEKAGLITGTAPARGSKIIDTDALEKVKFPADAVLDGHVAHFATADLYIVLRTNPDILRVRLKQRGWLKKKVDENVEAELLGVCSVEAREFWDNVMDLDTSKLTVEDALKIIQRWVRKGMKTTEPVDWIEMGYEPMPPRGNKTKKRLV